GSSSSKNHLTYKRRGTAMKKLVLIVFIVLLAYPAYGDGEDQAVVGMVNKALEFFKAQGKDQALKIVNASAGPLRKGALYCFAMDFKGRFVAHPCRKTCAVRMPGNSRTRRGNSSL